MTETIMVDQLSLEIRRSDRRKTIGITVDRDGSLIIAAPTNCPLAVVEKTVGEKRLWMYRKLAERELLLHPTTPKEFVDGEGFLYFGRSYRLRLRDREVGERNPVPLRLHLGRFELLRGEQSQARDHFVNWYAANGLPWIETRANIFANRISVQPTAIEIRDHGYRWGACSRDGKLYFHWRIVLLPPRIIEYVVVHELVHLRQPRHDKAFWKLVERTIPDFAERKRWLAENGGQYC